MKKSIDINEVIYGLINAAVGAEEDAAFFEREGSEISQDIAKREREKAAKWRQIIAQLNDARNAGKTVIIARKG